MQSPQHITSSEDFINNQQKSLKSSINVKNIVTLSQGESHCERYKREEVTDIHNNDRKEWIQSENFWPKSTVSCKCPK